MAGFFKNFSGNGKGVSKDEKEKKRIILFFEILWRKLWQVIGINIMYFIVILPLFSYIMMFIMQSVGFDAAELTTNTLFMVFGYILSLPSPLMWSLIALSAILYGPATCGMTYILRNYSRQEHVWTFSDFFDRAKKNFKQGFIAGLIDILLVLSCSMYLSMDTTALASTQWYLLIFKVIAIIVFVIYFVMRFYVYTLIVTFDMNFKAIIKNSWIFFVLGFGRNLISLFFIVLTIATSTAYPLAAFGCISISLSRFVAVFNGYPVIEKYMLKPIRAKQQAENGSEEDDGPVFIDDVEPGSKR